MPTLKPRPNRPFGEKPYSRIANYLVEEFEFTFLNNGNCTHTTTPFFFVFDATYGIMTVQTTHPESEMKYSIKNLKELYGVLQLRQIKITDCA